VIAAEQLRARSSTLASEIPMAVGDLQRPRPARSTDDEPVGRPRRLTSSYSMEALSNPVGRRLATMAMVARWVVASRQRSAAA
jgi:hypothetical protein